jgi:hypothetical protein
MTVTEMIKAINQLPNFLYVFYSEDGCHRVILGGASCLTKDTYENLNSAEYHFNIMEELYEKDNLTDDEKAAIGYRMKRIMNICDYRHTKLHRLKDQEDYLNSLDIEAQEQISKQIQMYQKAREYYKDYVYNKR